MELGLKIKYAFCCRLQPGAWKAVAIELAKEGAKLIINGRNKENLESTKQEIEKVSGG